MNDDDKTRDDAIRHQQAMRRQQEDDDEVDEQQRLRLAAAARVHEPDDEFEESTIEHAGAARPRRRLNRKRVVALGLGVTALALAAWLLMRPAQPPRGLAPVARADGSALPLALAGAAKASPSAPANVPTNPQPVSCAAPSFGELLSLQSVVATVTSTAADTKTLLTVQRHTDDVVTAMQGDLAQVKDIVSKLLAGQANLVAERHADQPVAAVQARPRVAAAPAAPRRPQAQLLSVDIWDNRPSVVIAPTAPGDDRVRFLAEGDSTNGVTLRAADPRSQRVVFDVSGREVVLQRELLQ